MASPAYYRPSPTVSPVAPPLPADVCIYGANAAGVMAAVQARRQGLKVILLNPSREIGGMTTGGLSRTDVGNKTTVAGLSREFYCRAGDHYGVEEEWYCEPHIAERVLKSFLDEVQVEVHHGHFVRTAIVDHSLPDGSPRITEIQTTSGLRVQASYFIDCSYEGDLAAAAKMPFSVGREANTDFGETNNGQQIHGGHQFAPGIDPYVIPGDPDSGLLPGIDPDPYFFPGARDHRIQSFNFRMCLTRNPANRVEFSPPDGYDPQNYALLSRLLETGWNRPCQRFDVIRGDKVDANNFGPFSTDFIGGSHGWPEGSYAERETIFANHVRYQQGYHWFLGHDESVSESIRADYQRWGLAADEFTHTNHWPHQLYIREGRRIKGQVMMTELHCRNRIKLEDPIAFGSYTMDSHNCRRIVHQGQIVNEGNVQIPLSHPYGISYRAITPAQSDCGNLLVPVALSASHIAYGSIRMEPVFMMTGQAAGAAVALAHHDARGSVQNVAYSRLKACLAENGQPLAPVSSNPDEPAAHRLRS